jgi:hypothetical protein
MLIIYPTTNYDSFCSLTDANTIISLNVPTVQRSLWDAITDDLEKEIYLRQASLIIKDKITPPNTLEDDLKKATAILANHQVGMNVTDKDDSHYIKRKKVDDLETEYFDMRQPDESIPSFVVSLLKQYEVQTSGSFVFGRA